VLNVEGELLGIDPQETFGTGIERVGFLEFDRLLDQGYDFVLERIRPDLRVLQG